MKKWKDGSKKGREEGRKEAGKIRCVFCVLIKVMEEAN